MWKRLALIFLVSVGTSALLSPVIAPFSYSEQFRDSANAPPGGKFLLGTDDMGRDRLSRLLYATAVSAVLAPAAAALSVLLALLACAFPGLVVGGLTTICLSIPWIFLFIILRAELPLNTDPTVSVLLTFALMGVAGWAGPARVFSGSIREMMESGWMLQARSAGIAGWRIGLVYAWPHLRSVALAQFRVLAPVYILAEASLGLLGLGVAEPMPSWGNLLRDLQHPDMVRQNPAILAPLLLLMLCLLAIEAVAVKTHRKEVFR